MSNKNDFKLQTKKEADRTWKLARDKFAEFKARFEEDLVPDNTFAKKLSNMKSNQNS